MLKLFSGENLGSFGIERFLVLVKFHGDDTEINNMIKNFEIYQQNPQAYEEKTRQQDISFVNELQDESEEDILQKKRQYINSSQDWRNESRQRQWEETQGIESPTKRFRKESQAYRAPRSIMADAKALHKRWCPKQSEAYFVEHYFIPYIQWCMRKHPKNKHSHKSTKPSRKRK